jgi:hypothetical protein
MSASEMLALAAAPVFAAMAFIAAGQPDAICSMDAWPVNGMALMYGLMALFHFAPWLRLLAGWRSRLVEGGLT